MAKILVAWEQGGGWGHLETLRPLIRRLIGRGHQVTLAARDLVRCVPTFAGMPVRLLQAPFLPVRAKPPFEQVECYAHVLANIGFDQPGAVVGMVAGWRGLYELAQPDAVIAEYAPTALLALRGTRVPRVVMGTGFSLPPDVFPLPAMVGPGRQDPARDKIERDENMVLATVNAALASWGGRPLQRLAQLFHEEVAASILRSYAELDHFGPRAGVTYWGAWPSEGGEAPQWPAAAEAKVFVYLRPCAARDAVLAELQRRGLPTVVAGEGFSAAEAAAVAGPTLCVSPRRLDISRAGAECDLAILNAGHNTVASFLLAGKPCLLFPSQMEQYLLAKRVDAMGAARVSSPHDTAGAVAALNQCLADDELTRCAAAFAERYRAVVASQQLTAVVDAMEVAVLRP